ncbi:ComF family protein [Metabacillus malikii]|uniref:Competence protein ComFC n=1 Tax=Metabacillus malikii TaxID=1504265 RepID=A0ABT9ZGN6_9BACI|nr:ComF family protein [Metabacillus malikii]MDQ0231448.1 competence protein ComFC [Metabacillus malikii]
MRCLICKQEISVEPSWTSLLLLKDSNTCESCEQQFERITGPTCPGCYRPQQTSDICPDCEKWEKDPQWKQTLQKNVSIYKYNDEMKEVLSLYKFRGDAALAQVFAKEIRHTYKKHYTTSAIDYTIPIPLSKERLYERGFNQAKLLANFIPLNQLDILQRAHHEKQSKKSRQQRLSSENVFFLLESSKIVGKNILLIDDIYTTGTTLRHAAKILIQGGASKVFSLTLIRS